MPPCRGERPAPMRSTAQAEHQRGGEACRRSKPVPRAGGWCGRHRRQRHGVVRLLGLRLLRPNHRQSLLPDGRPENLPARRLRRLRDRFPHAPSGRRSVRLYRRSCRSRARPALVRGGDGGAHLRDRFAAHLRRDRHRRLAADADLPLVQGLAVGGEYTSSAVFLAETAHPRQARRRRRLGALRGDRRHPAGLCRGRRDLQRAVPGTGRRLGLAFALPARRGGRRGRLHPAPAYAVRPTDGDGGVPPAAGVARAPATDAASRQHQPRQRRRLSTWRSCTSSPG